MIKAVTAIALQMPVAHKQGGRGQACYKDDESPATGLA